jgi:plasmid stabilization system protein ParE
MSRLVRPAFYDDLAREELWLLEHAGAEIADRWHEAVWRTLDYLVAHPGFGRQRRDLKFPGIRSWLVIDFERWVIFYGVRDHDLVFYRIVSGTMNVYALRFD